MKIIFSGLILVTIISYLIIKDKIRCNKISKDNKKYFTRLEEEIQTYLQKETNISEEKLEPIIETIIKNNPKLHDYKWSRDSAEKLVIKINEYIGSQNQVNI